LKLANFTFFNSWRRGKRCCWYCRF